MEMKLALAFGVVMGLVVASGTLSGMTDSILAGTEVCQMTIDPGVLLAGSDSVTIRVDFDDPIGDPPHAALPPESGLIIAEIQRHPVQPLIALLRLDTTEAVAGRWELSLTGKGRTCSAELVVEDPEDRLR